MVPLKSSQLTPDMNKSLELQLKDFAALEAIKVQVNNVERDNLELKAAVVGLDRKIEQNFNILAEKLEKRYQSPWGVIYTGLGLVLSFCIAIGGLAYIPIKADISRVETHQRQVDSSSMERDRRLLDMIITDRDKLNLLTGKFENKEKGN